MQNTGPISLTTTGATPATGIATLAKDAPDTCVLAVMHGTYGTVQIKFQGSLDGTNYFPVEAVDLNNGNVVTGTISLTDNTTVGYRILADGLRDVRVYVVAIASGTLVVDGQSQHYVNLPVIQNQIAGQTIGSWLPASNDGGALGSSSVGWSDLFLATGGVINWANGEVTITETDANTLTFAGASTGYKFANGPVLPAANDGAALGSTALGFSDLFLATGGVINWNNGEVTITETDANTLTIAGATVISFGANTLNATGSRILQSYHTNITSTNAVTVDSSETVKRDITPYANDALATIRGMNVVTFKHQEHLADETVKLGVIAESVSEPLALDLIPRENGTPYPGVNLYALAALQTRAIQQLCDQVSELRSRLASAGA